MAKKRMLQHTHGSTRHGQKIGVFCGWNDEACVCKCKEETCQHTPTQAAHAKEMEWSSLKPINTTSHIHQQKQILILVWPKIPPSILSKFSQKPPLATPPINPKHFHTSSIHSTSFNNPRNHQHPICRKQGKGTDSLNCLALHSELLNNFRCILSYISMSNSCNLCFALSMIG